MKEWKEKWDLNSIYAGFKDQEYITRKLEIEKRHAIYIEYLKNAIQQEPVDPVKEITDLIHKTSELMQEEFDMFRYANLRIISDCDDQDARDEFEYLEQYIDKYDFNTYDQMLCEFFYRFSNLDELMDSNVHLFCHRNFIRRYQYLPISGELPTNSWRMELLEKENLLLQKTTDILNVDLQDAEGEVYKLYELTEEVLKEDLALVAQRNKLIEDLIECFIEIKRINNHYFRTIYGMDLQNYVIEHEYLMKMGHFSAFLEEAKIFFDLNIKYQVSAMICSKECNQDSDYISNDEIASMDMEIRENEEIEAMINYMHACYESFCPDYVEFVENAIRSGWVDFYDTPEKRLCIDSGTCFEFYKNKESRICITAERGKLKENYECVFHELGHAYLHSINNKECSDISSDILEEIFSILLELISFSYELQENKTAQILGMEKGVYWLAKKRNFGSMCKRGMLEKRIIEMLVNEKHSSKEDFCSIYEEIYGDSVYSFNADISLFYNNIYQNTLYSIRYCIASVLALYMYRELESKG